MGNNCVTLLCGCVIHFFRSEDSWVDDIFFLDDILTNLNQLIRLYFNTNTNFNSNFII